MKIAFISQPIDPVLPPHQSSIGLWTYEISRRLAKSNDVLVYHRARPKQKVGRRTRIDNVAFQSIPTHNDKRILSVFNHASKWLHLKVPVFTRSFYYIFYALKISIKLRRQKCDIVHIHNFSQFLPIVKKLTPSTKIILHMHCEWLTQIDKTVIEKRLKHADLIISCSDYITRKNQQSFPQFSHRFQTVYNGYNPDYFHKPADTVTTDSLQNGKKIMFVGRISPEKGIHVLIDAFSQISNRDPNLSLHLIGPHASAPKEYIVDLSRDPKVQALSTLYTNNYLSFLKSKLIPQFSDRVFFHKQLPQNKLADIYHHGCLFVFPSVWEEPFGMPIIEAMACGLPVIATCGGGVPEIVQHMKNGVLVERDDAPALADAILLLMNDKQKYEAIRSAGMHHVSSRFTWERVSLDIAAVYALL